MGVEILPGTPKRLLVLLGGRFVADVRALDVFVELRGHIDARDHRREPFLLEHSLDQQVGARVDLVVLGKSKQQMLTIIMFFTFTKRML